MKEEKPKIIQIKELLSIQNLCIPEYQRPYKWTIKNVNQLIDDMNDSRKFINNAFNIKEYLPKDRDDWDHAYKRFKNLCKE